VQSAAEAASILNLRSGPPALVLSPRTMPPSRSPGAIELPAKVQFLLRDYQGGQPVRDRATRSAVRRVITGEDQTTPLSRPIKAHLAYETDSARILGLCRMAISPYLRRRRINPFGLAQPSSSVIQSMLEGGDRLASVTATDGRGMRLATALIGVRDINCPGIPYQAATTIYECLAYGVEPSAEGWFRTSHMNYLVLQALVQAGPPGPWRLSLGGELPIWEGEYLKVINAKLDWDIELVPEYGPRYRYYINRGLVEFWLDSFPAVYCEVPHQEGPAMFVGGGDDVQRLVRKCKVSLGNYALYPR
jgi:hypothetical protein